MNKPVYLDMSILDVSKTSMYEYGVIILSQNMKTMRNYAIWIQIVLLFILKLKIFTKILQMILKNDLTHKTILKMIKDPFQ